MKKFNVKSLIAAIIALIIGALLGTTTTVTLKPTEETIVAETNFAIELKEAEVVETSADTLEVVDAPKVESIDGNQIATECGEDEECGRGWYVDTSTYKTFYEAVINQCVDTDGHYGSQCWDLGNLFWQNYAGRTLSTCGTGAAKGTLNCYENNAGGDFEMIWDATQLQPGDWVVFTNGQYGHIGMAMGGYSEGYVSLLGTNQGGTACQGGGSSANIINISLKNFGGAFRPKSYIKVEPVEPVIPVTGCVQWHVLRGDTMSKIMLECENTVVYGPAMDAYAQTWYSLVYKPGQSVYDGWHSKTGVGLYAGDDIEHRTE